MFRRPPPQEPPDPFDNISPDELTADVLSLLRLQEQLRQERESFVQAKAERQLRLTVYRRVAMVATGLLPFITAVCSYIILKHADFGAGTVTAATGTLFGEVVGVSAFFFKATTRDQGGSKALAPVTRALPATARGSKRQPEPQNPPA
jgi:hypothetical protein